MVLHRCAWHTRYHGYPLIYSLTRSQGWKVSCADGICRNCAERVREEWRLVKLGRQPRTRLPSLIRGAVLGLTVLVTLLGAESVDAPLAPAPTAIAPTPPPQRSAPDRAVAAPTRSTRRAAAVGVHAVRARTRGQSASASRGIRLVSALPRTTQLVSALPDLDLSHLRMMVQFVTAPRALAVPLPARPPDVVIQTP